MNSPQQYKFGFRAWLPVIGLAFAAFVFNTSEFLPVGLLPNIAQSLDETVSKTGLIITVYAWMVAILSLPLTVLTAKLERRRLLLGLIILFAASHFVILWVKTFEALMVARVCVAMTHSVFWSIMTPLAARVAPFGKQALGLAMVMGGTIVATVLGVPLGTKLGQLFGWQGSFFVVGVAASFIWLLIFLVLPISPSNRAGSLKSLPLLLKRRSLLQLYLIVVLGVLGQFTVYSYISPILIKVGEISEASTVVILFIFGLSGLIGTLIGSKNVDKHRSASLIVPLILLSLCLFLIIPFSQKPFLLITLTIIWGASITALMMSFQTLLLAIAKDAADVATAMFSGIFNIGIGGGAFLGGLASSYWGFGVLGFLGGSLVGLCVLICIMVYLKTGSAIIPFKEN